MQYLILFFKCWTKSKFNVGTNRSTSSTEGSEEFMISGSHAGGVPLVHVSTKRTRCAHDAMIARGGCPVVPIDPLIGTKIPIPNLKTKCIFRRNSKFNFQTRKPKEKNSNLDSELDAKIIVNWKGFPQFVWNINIFINSGLRPRPLDSWTAAYMKNVWKCRDMRISSKINNFLLTKMNAMMSIYF